MIAKVQIVPVENQVYVRLEGESNSDAMLIKLMEFETPTWRVNQAGQLECNLTVGRKE
jgi:hypothetical protein